jgi:NAD(P)H-hydrate epimerase
MNCGKNSGNNRSVSSTFDQRLVALPVDLYTAEQARELDAITINQYEVAGFTLMRRAGRVVFDTIVASYPELKKMTVVCGTGNNGGDGFVVATLARQYGIAVEIVQVGDGSNCKGDALQARQLAEQDGIAIVPFATNQQVLAQGIIVDALLGTGLSGPVRGDYLAAIEWINASGVPVIACDVPSGICSDTGAVLGDSAVYAAYTVSFIGLKQGLLTGAAPDYTGELSFADLAVPVEVYLSLNANSQRLELSTLTATLPTRTRTSHKGKSGHVLVAGGDSGMAGAAALASEAATRVGAGLTSCATRPEHVSAIVSRCPVVMVSGVISGQEIEPLLTKADVIVIGPGLGQGPWGEQLLQQSGKLSVPLVVDADALNILAAGRVINQPYRDNWILTPHPGEAARLLDCSIADIQQDRFAAITELQRRYGGAVILKGAGSLVLGNDGEKIGICPYGNPGMASGGMGDVLSGVLGALLAQGLSVSEAARLGVCLHSYAADLAAVDGERGMVASDLMPYLRTLVNL